MRTLINCTALLALSAAVYADPVLWNNGAPTLNSFACDTNNSCVIPGWTVGDDFTLSSGATITGFTYNDFFTGGSSASDYTGTAWNIWNGNPFSGGTVVASGSTTGATSAGLAGTELISITGLNVLLSPGTYWLGIETQEANGAIWSRALSSDTGDYKQWSGPTNDGGSGLGQDRFNLLGETAFTVEGNGTSAVPEPSNVVLVGLGMAGMLVRRLRRAGSN
ncbi:MAG TPA: PEP-CTERM sorting domain-containing protein [Bryobacteraceae bacterium]|nr:PEP-CTERM sorting domain-containing protein [Bryobacteraceae bacterium]